MDQPSPAFLCLLFRFLFFYFGEIFTGATFAFFTTDVAGGIGKFRFCDFLFFVVTTVAIAIVVFFFYRFCFFIALAIVFSVAAAATVFVLRMLFMHFHELVNALVDHEAEEI